MGEAGKDALRVGFDRMISADDWWSVLEPVIERYRDLNVPRFFPANAVLERHVVHLLSPVGRPPNKPQRFNHTLEYRAQSWERPRHVVAKVQWHQGELFPHVGSS